MNGVLEIKAERCLGCHTCELECALAHSKSKTFAEAVYSSEHVYPRMILETDGDTTIPMPCRHCTDAPCVRVCPTSAMSRSGLGMPVVLNLRKCIGCRACVMMCPYGVIQTIPGRVALSKCDLCVDRLAREEIPACAASCPTGAIEFTQIADIAAEKRETIMREFAAPGRQYKIDEENCNGCTLCRVKCPYDAVIGEKKEPHRIDDSKCVNCGVCFAVCRFDAVKKFSDVDMVFCADCGQPVGAGTHMDRIKQKTTVNEQLLSYCAACRRKKVSSGLAVEQEYTGV